MKTKVLFVYYNNTEDAFLPVCFAVLGGMMRDNGIECRVFDTSFWNDIAIGAPSPRDREVREKLGQYKKVSGFNLLKEDVNVAEKFDEVVADYKPGLIAISSTSHEYKVIKDFVTPVKKKYGIPVIIGGAHATVIPEKVIVDEGIDMVCVGEGEDALLEVVLKLEAGQVPCDIPSVWYKHSDGRIQRNKIRCQAKPMDALPEPNWDILDPRHRVRPFEGEIKNVAFFECSRGCPYNCSYCINATLHKIQADDDVKTAGAYRYHTPVEIVRRLKKYKEKYGFNHLQFIDENMPTMPIAKLKEFAELYKRDVGVQFFTQSRPEYFVRQPEKAKILADMGCVMVAMGAEAGNEELRRTVLNRPMKDGILEKASQILKDAGIMVAAYYIIGFPYETREMIEETIELHKRIAPHRHSIRFLHPFPGAPLRELCIKNGWLADNDEDIKKSYFVEPVLNLPPPCPTKEELIELRQKFSDVWTWNGKNK